MNIQFFLQAISDSGMSDAKIGERIGAAQSIVWRLRTGVHKKTDFDRGNKIQALYQEILKRKAA